MERRGFTLIELIVVIAILAILASLLAVFVVGMIDQAKIKSTRAFLSAVDTACQVYRMENNSYPPDDRGDSRCLHYYLGRERMVTQGRPESGPVQTVKAPPHLVFPKDWLSLAPGQVPDANQPVPLVDPWGSLIRYKVPGTYNSRGVDLWSPGKNLQDDPVPPGGVTDDVSNWLKE